MAPPSSEERRALALLRNRVGLALFVHYLLLGGLAWLFLWGLAVLVLRVTLAIATSWLMLGALGLLPVLIAAFLAAWRRLPSERVLLALIDKHNQSGGLVLAAEEVDIRSWRSRLQMIAAPKVRLRSGRYLLLIALGCLFVGGAMLMPEMASPLGAPHRLEVGDEVDQLEDQLALLEQEKIVTPEKAETIREKLDQIERNAEGDGPVKTWEALDHMKNDIAQTAQQAAQESVQEAEQLAKAQSLAQGMANDFDALDPETMAAAMETLSAMLEKAEAEAQTLQSLPEVPTPEDLQNLAGECTNCRLGKGEMLGRLAEGQLIDVQLLELLEGLEPCDCEGLAEFLAECEGLDAGDCTKMWAECKLPGRGGVTRGRGDAAMTWKDETDPTGAKFQEKALPPGTLAGMKNSQLVAVSVGSPDDDASGDADGQGAGLHGAASGAGSARTQTILPRHRGAVGRYFDRGE